MPGQAQITPGSLIIGLLFESGLGFPRTEWMTYSALVLPHLRTLRWAFTVPLLSACVIYDTFINLENSTAFGDLRGEIVIQPVSATGVLLDPVRLHNTSYITNQLPFQSPEWPICLLAGSLVSAYTTNLDGVARQMSVGIRHNFVTIQI